MFSGLQTLQILGSSKLIRIKLSKVSIMRRAENLHIIHLDKVCRTYSEKASCTSRRAKHNYNQQKMLILCFSFIFRRYEIHTVKVQVDVAVFTPFIFNLNLSIHASYI